MATTNNLGRVQGISLWVADGVVTTTGTITLTNSTMHPLINDNVVDSNGNVFKIIAVSGTNPYTITTSGTPIYRITSNGMYTLDKIFNVVVTAKNYEITLSDEVANYLKQISNNIINNGDVYKIVIYLQSNVPPYAKSTYSGEIPFYYSARTTYVPQFSAFIHYGDNVDSSCYIEIGDQVTLRVLDVDMTNRPLYLYIYKFNKPTSTLNVYDSFIRLESEEEVYQTNDFDTMLDNLINKPSETIIYVNNIGYAYFETTDNNLYNNSVEIINEEEQTKTTYTCSLNKTDKTIKVTSNVEPYIKEEEK